MRLCTPDGGTWRLHAPSSGYGLVGREVRLHGVRVGFDEINVNWIEPLEAISPSVADAVG